MKIIPAIDLINGKCVRLSQGDYNQVKNYNNNPYDLAKRMEDIGIKYLHVVDLDGAKLKKVINLKVLEKLAIKTNLNIEFGGGINSNFDINSVFNAGANQVIIGSIAIKKPNLFIDWIKYYGPEKIILGADCIKNKIAIDGWINISNYNIIDFIEKFKKKGINQVICTDISKDGMLKGPAYSLYKKIISKIKIDLIASGGVTNLEDIKNLKKIGCKGVIIGKAIYEKKISLKDLKIFL